MILRHTVRNWAEDRGLTARHFCSHQRSVGQLIDALCRFKDMSWQLQYTRLGLVHVESPLENCPVALSTSCADTSPRQRQRKREVLPMLRGSLQVAGRVGSGRVESVGHQHRLRVGVRIVLTRPGGDGIAQSRGRPQVSS